MTFVTSLEIELPGDARITVEPILRDGRGYRRDIQIAGAVLTLRSGERGALLIPADAGASRLIEDLREIHRQARYGNLRLVRDIAAEALEGDPGFSQAAE
jgi:hypothetical protein